MNNTKMNYLNDLNIRLSEMFSADEIKKIICTATLTLNEYEMQERCTELAIMDNESEKFLKRFLATKKVEGRSLKTLGRYEYIIRRMMNYLNIPIKEMDVYALRLYLAELESKGSCDNTIEGIRSVFSSFFTWLHNEGFIEKNPTCNLNTIKCKKVVRKPFSKVEIEKLKLNCKNERDRTIIEFLLSTGCRVSEVVGVDIADVDFSKQECKVLGKGNKERIVFLNDVCAMHLQEYLKNRTDEYPALFPGKGTERLSAGGIRFMLKCIEESSGVSNVHPHRFRRTCATSLINKGMSIQNVACVLGHVNVNTTMTYVYSDINDVKSSFFKG